MLACNHLTRFSAVLLFILFSTVALAQKKKLGPEMYDEWKKIEQVQQTPSGNWISYEITPLEGDGILWIESPDNNIERSYARGQSAVMNYNDQFVAFLIKPQHDTIRKLKLDKVKPIKHPKDTLAIYWTAKDSIVKYPNVKSFKVAKEGDWIAYMSSKDLRPKSTGKKKKKKKKKKGVTEKIKSTGKTLFVYNPVSGKKKKLHRVKDYTINRLGTQIAYTTSKKGDKDSLSLHVLSLPEFKMTTLCERKQSIVKMTFDHSGQQLVYLSSTDTAKSKNYSLGHWKIGDHNGHTIVDSTTKGMPDGWTVSHFFTPYFSRNGERVYLGTNEIRRDLPKDTLLESEKAHVDVWYTEDLRVQPEQLAALKRDERKAFKAVFLLANKKFNQLANETVENVRTYDQNNSDYGLGVDRKPFSKERTWTYPWRANYYKVSIKGGKHELMKKGLYYNPSMSPSGKYLVWFNVADSSWMGYDVFGKKDVNLSKHFNTSFAQDANGVPGHPSPEFSYGWSKIDGDEYYVVEDAWDIWYLHPSNTEKSFCLTGGKGRENKMKYYLWRTEFDSTYISLDRAVLKGRDDLTKNESIHQISGEPNKATITQVIETPHKITYFRKAKKSDKVLMRRMSFIDYPELETTTLSLDKFETISSTNPQQSEYNWGTVEFVDWKAYDSTKLRGLLYKPEDFDPNKKYPMMVYFYEDYQNNVHFYYPPKPTASIIYATEYISNGYIVFIPDVRYEEGHPAKSAYNCIVSGTDYLTNKYDWIDTSRLALQGQSWGGYQTAQLITMTDKYKCGMAGAPVSNMFSAFGGIRWGSGLSRQFQYERGQSRIGYTIWEKPELYIENSPIFHLPKVNTPVLIMHNDNDGAVPWYQGIEMFMGLRRLDKPAWLLNYNNDHHNLTKLPNKRDLSIRMRQFFDYYLLDAPMPMWMKEGLPATDKGIETGYELEK